MWLLVGSMGLFVFCGACDKKEAAKTPVPKTDKQPAKKPKPAEQPAAKITAPQGMLHIPKGEFWMGCKPETDKDCEEPEKPGHNVYLDDYFIDKTEVSVGQFEACVKAGSCSDKGLAVPSWNDKQQPDWAWSCNWGKPDRKNHPINCLSWEQADSYCKWASKRLPTEAEWEKAARGSDGRKYAWGNEEYAELGKAGKLVANIADESEKKRDPLWEVATGYDDGHTGTAPVGSFPKGASPHGVLDMTGNVLEWVADWYAEDYYKKSPPKNPKGPATGELRVARGGAWYGEPKYTRISLRWPNPIRRIVAVGVRCASSVKE